MREMCFLNGKTFENFFAILTSQHIVFAKMGRYTEKNREAYASSVPHFGEQDDLENKGEN